METQQTVQTCQSAKTYKNLITHVNDISVSALISPKKKKKTGWEKIIKARPCATSLDWSRDPDAASIYGSVHPINTLDLKDPEAPWTMRSMEF